MSLFFHLAFVLFRDMKPLSAFYILSTADICKDDNYSISEYKR